MPQTGSRNSTDFVPVPQQPVFFGATVVTAADEEQQEAATGGTGLSPQQLPLGLVLFSSWLS
jgi:hypothetical protein